MKLSNFKSALSSLARTDTTPLVLTPSLTLHVGRIDTSNTDYVARMSEFVRNNPNHRVSTDRLNFFNELVSGAVTEGLDTFLANLVVTGWDLKDDEGKPQAFSIDECVELFNLPEGIGHQVMSRTLNHALTETHYVVDWESVVTKNS
jgi:hypothetical protein